MNHFLSDYHCKNGIVEKAKYWTLSVWNMNHICFLLGIEFGSLKMYIFENVTICGSHWKRKVTHDGEHGEAKKIYTEIQILFYCMMKMLTKWGTYLIIIFWHICKFIIFFPLDKAIDTCQTFNDTSAAFVCALWTRRVTSATLRRVLFKRTSWR